ncbi:MAG TPA: hypothetical protein DCP69_07385 [Candidatus Omnitrophica bacterium]|nr:hypothetical protein [Candidatus Omnitrophota bacterium]
MDFAVRVKGIHDDDPNTATWVLVVNGDRLLIAHDDKTLHWHPLKDCTFAKAATPDHPRPVVAVQPRSARPKLVTPNRVQRRAIERNGG